MLRHCSLAPESTPGLHKRVPYGRVKLAGRFSNEDTIDTVQLVVSSVQWRSQYGATGIGSGCGVQRRRRRLAIVRLPIRVQCRFGLETLGRTPTDANDMPQKQTSKSLL